MLSAALVLGSALSVYGGTKEDLQGAVKKLSDAPGYSWKTTTEGGQGRGGGSTEGKTEKDGFTWYTMTMRNNTNEIIVKGDKGAVKLADGWKSLEEAASAQADAGQPNPGRNLARLAKTLKTPAAQASDLIDKAGELTKSEDAITANLSEDAAKSLMAMAGGGGRRRGGANAGGGAAAAPQISNAKGSVKFWTNKDGVLTKLQYNVQGTVNRNGQDAEVNRTTTIEISDVGTTKVDVPAEAKAKAGA
jgi:hypothetical protein